MFGKRIVGAAAVVMALLLAGGAQAQEAKTPSALDVTYITDDYLGAVVINPARLMASPALKGQPSEQLVALIKRYGLEPRQIEQIILLLPAPRRGERFGFDTGRGERLPPTGIHGVLRLTQPVADAKLLAKIVESLGHGELKEVDTGRVYWKASQRMDLAFDVADESTVFFADERTVRSRLVSRVGAGPLAETLKKADASADVLAAIDPAAVRRLLRDPDVDSEAAPLFANVGAQVLRRLKSISLTYRADRTQFEVQLAAYSKADAELVADLARGGKALATVMADAVKANGRRGEEDANEAWLGLTVDLQLLLLSGLNIVQADDRVSLEFDLKGRQTQFAVAIAKAIGEARDAGKAAQSMNNLRQLALAIHLYHDTYGHFPLHATYPREIKRDKRGADTSPPLLSWRVQLLPYIEQASLYSQFRQDEPWDSEHNKKLIAKMPDVFKSPQRGLGEGKTCYVVPISNDRRYTSIFPSRHLTGDDPRAPSMRPYPQRFASVVDGTSNTIMIVEAPPEKAVIWTKPDDWEVDIKDPKKGLFGAWKGFALAALADGSVQRVKEDVPVDTLRRAIGRADGEVLDWEELYGPPSRGGPPFKKATAVKPTTPGPPVEPPAKKDAAPDAKKE